MSRLPQPPPLPVPPPPAAVPPSCKVGLAQRQGCCLKRRRSSAPSPRAAPTVLESLTRSAPAVGTAKNTRPARRRKGGVLTQPLLTGLTGTLTSATIAR